jgi:hypothetical protein
MHSFLLHCSVLRARRRWCGRRTHKCDERFRRYASVALSLVGEAMDDGRWSRDLAWFSRGHLQITRFAMWAARRGRDVEQRGIVREERLRPSSCRAAGSSLRERIVHQAPGWVASLTIVGRAQLAKGAAVLVARGLRTVCLL